jgi:tripartite ATP-independent transporter DctM subunit
MIMVTVVFIGVTEIVPLTVVPNQIFSALERASLLAIPFFLLTGELMNTGRLTERLLLFSRELVGRVRGGLAQVNIMLSMLFAGMNGSSVADTATVGSILIPSMKQSGYSAAFSAAITAVSSTIGGIIPPSIAMVLLASGVGMSVGGLFAAAIVPGIVVGLGLMVQTYFIARRRGYERYEVPFTWNGLLESFRACFLAMLIPVVLIGGIVFGVFTAGEAGAITAICALFLGVVIYRGFTRKSLNEALFRTVKNTSSVFIIIAAAGPFSWLLGRIGALDGLEQWMLSYADQPIVFLFVFIGFILLVGMIMDAVANLIILGPTLISIASVAGYPEFQSGVVVAVGFLIGTATPPIGVSYFTASHIAQESLEKVAVAMVPFLLLEVVILFLMMLVPSFTMWMPEILGFV